MTVSTGSIAEQFARRAFPENDDRTRAECGCQDLVTRASQ